MTMTQPEPGTGDDALGEAERALVEICREVLRVDLGPDDRLPDLGTRSILIIEIAVRLQDRLGADVPLETLLEGRTVRGLAEAVVEARSEAAPR
ncbi:acyl carrier protein [Actinomadura spongiicola]|nr:acyl carrier protein [Actinomadura spongiicola]